jgi:hypothetical protein
VVKLAEFDTVVVLNKTPAGTMPNNLVKYVSWNATSKDAFERITPVKPPIVKSAIKPIAKISGVLNFKLPP